MAAFSVKNMSTILCKVSSPLYRSSLSNCTTKRPTLSSCTAIFQHPPMPRSLRSGMMCITLLSVVYFSIISDVPSVEPLSTTIRLYSNVVFCFSTLSMASAMVRALSLTGITTVASTWKLFPSSNLMVSYSPPCKYALIALR